MSYPKAFFLGFADYKLPPMLGGGALRRFRLLRH
jgi:hypothetical protein